ncbi:MAG: dihydrofolate synthetase fol3 [Lasallia pustulata]|uniref:Dihydrofolate synthetase n=1 Tax=Lasallia pustulata TaxID=136370 RepID=A0A5M8PMW5_9LECA|nr:MAG: dihydrofolate synthetase fol3 [Lasallia pustulata]
MIELGLARIGRLLRPTNLPWRAIHVAGTNGKGSVCAYVSAMLHAGNISCGRFNSPHLIDRWDCIAINEKTVDESLFRKAEAEIKARDAREGVGASEFELLTATAFEIFANEKVEIGVVEVGMGGRLDATNILQDPLVTVITRIGIDHEAFLGNTLEAIAVEKAGIMKPGVPCVIDGMNVSVFHVFERTAALVGAGPVIQISPSTSRADDELWNAFPISEFELHQQINLRLAYEAVRQALARLHSSTKPSQLLPAIHKASWPGRLQSLSMRHMTGRTEDILLDGAHNAQSAEVLGLYVNRKLRQRTVPVTWTIAISKGKDIQRILRFLIQPGDNVIAAEFGRVDGMPWVQPMAARDILESAHSMGALACRLENPGNIEDALQQASGIARGGPLVMAGSLYLISDVLRLMRAWK